MTSTRADFHDWISPVIVKELRQGMRTKLFVSALLLLQAAMAFAMLLSTISSEENRSDFAGLFWGLVCLPLLLVIPARGLGSVSDEVKANTLELVHLTQLTAWRIVVGKWTALALQTLLLACSALPYIVLRYFLGGVNMLDELAAIGWITLGSLFLSALAVAGSAMMKQVLLRLLAGGALLFFLFSGVLFSVFPGMYGIGGTTLHGVLTILAVTLLTGLLVLEFGAAAIAPEAENHSGRKRLLALVLLAGFVAMPERRWDFGTFVAMCILLPVAVLAVCEPLSTVRTVYQPFLQRGFFGRLAGRLFYPGWPSGVFFAVLVAAILTWKFGWGPQAGGRANSWEELIAIALAGAVFAPLFVARLLPFKPKLAIFLGQQAIMAVIAGIAGAATANPDSRGYVILGAFFPSSSLLLALGSALREEERAWFFYITGRVTYISIAGLILLALFQERRILELERAAQRSLEPPVA